MLRIETTQFGLLEYSAADVYRFPLGLPGFEDRQQFVLVQRPEFAPIVFLQSTEQGSLRFACTPVQLIDPRYSLALSETEATLLNPAASLATFGILTFPDSGRPTINLLAPVVLNEETRVGLQSIQLESSYSAEQLLQEPSGMEASCS